ncbi:TraQ conjugal transfer family protein, partial [Prevotella nigrescens]|uniref:TraQ conjugal transfer family protein n=1 Tax=Prevotella nigrescens TaxID=28133 RepID=UPI003613E3C6
AHYVHSDKKTGVIVVLKSDKSAVFADTRYTIRYFQSDGKGLLRNDNGTVFKPNDRYPLTKDVFRLYYTSLSSDRQTIDVYVEDSFGRVQQLTFSFNNEREEGKKPASSRR